jgi:streptomycin 6-kinase
VQVLDPEFVLNVAARDRLVDRFGPGAVPWCAALPGLVERCCLRWHLELYQALSGGTSRVFIGRQNGNRAVVLKLTPDRSIADAEALALGAWAATLHVPDLLDADLCEGALLLEKVEPGAKLSDQAELPPFTEIADLLLSLRAAPQDAIGQLPTLGERLDFLYGLIHRRLIHPQVRSLVTPELASSGHRLAKRLATGGDSELVHGDLHLGNVLRGGPSRGLVAIDPRPCIGDHTFDVVDWALGRATSTRQLAERIQQLCALVPDLNGDAVWQWCTATAVINAVQHLYRRPPNDSTRLLLRLARNA